MDPQAIVATLQEGPLSAIASDSIQEDVQDGQLSKEPLQHGNSS